VHPAVSATAQLSVIKSASIRPISDLVAEVDKAKAAAVAELAKLRALPEFQAYHAAFAAYQQVATAAGQAAAPEVPNPGAAA
jgi:hypothetical protein